MIADGLHPLPPPDRRRIHGIIVARGAGEACKTHFGGGTGSFAIDISIKGDEHWDSTKGPVRPFWIGDVNPFGSFLHILDDGSLDVLLTELDTVTDFSEYLTKKEKFVRSKYFGHAHGEEDLYSFYAFHMDENDQHDFVEDNGKPWPEDQKIIIDGTHYATLLRHPQYFLKKQADKDSYIWDKLIKNFTDSIIDGTSIQPWEKSYDISKSEIAVREMALENRFERRSHGAAIKDAIQTFEESQGDMFNRIMMPTPGKERRPIGFFFFISTFSDWHKENGGYDIYRKMRVRYAEIYAKAILLRYSHLAKVVGISVQATNNLGSSEDLIYAERRSFSESEANDIRDQCEKLGIMRDDMKMRNVRGNEYPDFSDDDLILAFAGPEPQKASYPHRQHTQASKENKKHRNIGRNEQCPCGSGEKYKKCCLLR